jgi:hypothetical protein
MCWILTMELWVQSWVTSCEVYAWHRDTAANFLLSLFVLPCHHNSIIRAIKSGFGSNGKIRPLARVYWLKVYTLGLKGLNCTINKLLCYCERWKHMQHIRGLGLLSDCHSPIFLPVSAPSHRHCPSLLHIHLLPPPEMCVGCDCAAHYHILSLK